MIGLGVLYALFLLFVWGCGLTASNADSINDPRSNDSNRLGVGAHRSAD